MKELQPFTALLLAACIFLTACGGSLTKDHNNAASGSAVSAAAVSGQSITENLIPQKMTAKTPYYEDDENEYEAIFTIKESTSQQYRAEVSVRAEVEDASEIPQLHWELYLDLADEIKEISGATILSHEGTHYIIRGDIPKHSPDDGLDEESAEYKVSFEITVAYHDKPNKPRFCFFSKKLNPLSDKKYDCQLVDLEKKGGSLTGKIRLINRSGKKIPGWELSIDSNFKINSLEGNYTYSKMQYYTEDGKEQLWKHQICSTTGNLDLKAGETKEIPFTGICPAKKPALDESTLYRQYEIDDQDTWYALECKYGGSFGKMDQYLVADTVFGMDVLFVFDEKKEDRYTATAELTNVVPVPYDSSGSKEDDNKGQAIADWEIYLECEDSIESITGAEIVSHEGNVYHIRAEDPDKWIVPFSFTTFQVEVSCPEGIHPLGKTYLARAKVKSKHGSDTIVKEQKFTIDKNSFKKAASTLWFSYCSLYSSWYDADDFGDDYYGEWDRFLERQEWGKKMGRMLEE